MRRTDAEISLRFVKRAFNSDLESMDDFSKLSEAVWITNAPLDISIESVASVVVVDAVGNGSARHIEGADTAAAIMVAATPLTTLVRVMIMLLCVEVDNA